MPILILSQSEKYLRYRHVSSMSIQINISGFQLCFQNINFELFYYLLIISGSRSPIQFWFQSLAYCRMIRETSQDINSLNLGPSGYVPFDQRPLISTSLQTNGPLDQHLKPVPIYQRPFRPTEQSINRYQYCRIEAPM